MLVVLWQQLLLLCAQLAYVLLQDVQQEHVAVNEPLVAAAAHPELPVLPLLPKLQRLQKHLQRRSLAASLGLDQAVLELLNAYLKQLVSILLTEIAPEGLHLGHPLLHRVHLGLPPPCQELFAPHAPRELSPCRASPLASHTEGLLGVCTLVSCLPTDTLVLRASPYPPLVLLLLLLLLQQPCCCHSDLYLLPPLLGCLHHALELVDPTVLSGPWFHYVLRDLLHLTAGEGRGERGEGRVGH